MSDPATKSKIWHCGQTWCTFLEVSKTKWKIHTNTMDEFDQLITKMSAGAAKKILSSRLQELRDREAERERLRHLEELRLARLERKRMEAEAWKLAGPRRSGRTQANFEGFFESEVDESDFEEEDDDEESEKDETPLKESPGKENEPRPLSKRKASSDMTMIPIRKSSRKMGLEPEFISEVPMIA
jgi:hypothetical protein